MEEAQEALPGGRRLGQGAGIVFSHVCMPTVALTVALSLCVRLWVAMDLCLVV